MRAVLDPNVIISAALSRSGTPARLLRSWLAGGYELVLSPALLDELARALAYRKIASRVNPDEAVELIDLLREHALMVDDPEGLPSVRSTDSGDNYLIALAEVASSVLVSGDGDLLHLAGQIPVYSPAQFWILLDADLSK